MATVVDTRGLGRNRLRTGKRVRYFPTAAEIAALGAGPWSGVIVKVNDDGTCNLALDVAVPTAGSAAVTAVANASAPSAGYVQAEATSAANLVNDLKAKWNAAVPILNGAPFKLNVREGGNDGQFSTLRAN